MIPNSFIKVQNPDGLILALNKQVPVHLRAYSFKQRKPYWGVVIKDQNGDLHALNMSDMEEEFGPFTLHVVSDFENSDPAKVGRFGVYSWGTFEDEPNHLAMLYERRGGGTGAVHFAIHPTLGLLIGQQPAERNRKMKLRGYEVPRGYDGATVAGIRERYVAAQSAEKRQEEAQETALRESEEEATSYEFMNPFTITWDDGAPFTTDQNGSTDCSGEDEGFKYQAVRWPITLLRLSSDPALAERGVYEPDTDNPIVHQSTGDKEAGHTGEMYFVSVNCLMDRTLLPGWSQHVSGDGLGFTGVFALMNMLGGIDGWVIPD